jgi:hypothetical protein
MKHSKGPWKHSGDIINKLEGLDVVDSFGDQVCTVQCDIEYGTALCIANANLIQVSPELLSAVKLAYERLSISEYIVDRKLAFEVLSPLIDKAEGQSNETR